MPRPRPSALKVACMDFETYYDKQCSVTTLGIRKYMEHPLFDPYLVAIHGDGIEYTGEPHAFDWKRLDGYQIIAHNASFDEAVFQFWGKPRWCPTWRTQLPWQCTADLSAFLGLGRSLKDAAKHGLGVEVSKTVRKQMEGKKWTELDADTRASWIAYAGEDARLSYLLWKQYADQWPAAERAMSLLERSAGWRGITVDQDLLQESLLVVKARIAEILKLIPYVNEDTTPAARKAFAAECEKHGVPVPKSRKKDDPDFLTWIKTYSEKMPWVECLSEYASLNKTLNFYETVKTRTLSSGRVGYGVLYYGAHTGRSSGEGGLNMLNLNKGEVLGTTIRNLFIAAPGKKLIASDSTQIEPRVAAWTSGETEFLENCRKMSPYIAHGMARGLIDDYAAFNKARRVNGSEEAQLYASLKVEILAGQFGGGAGTALREAEKMKIPMTPEEAQALIDNFRRARSGVVRRWAHMWQEFTTRYSMGQDPIEIPIASGRVLRYCQVHHRSGNRGRPDWYAKNSYADRQASKVYASVVMQNETQALARDVLMDQRRRVVARAPWMTYLLNVYDELIFEVDDDRAEEGAAIVDQEMSTPPAWAPDLPVGCDVSVLTAYEK